MKKILVILMLLAAGNTAFAQFGKNKVQYKDYTWYYIQTLHFDIYYSQGGERIAEFAAKAVESALDSIQKSFDYRINNRISFIIYKSGNDFQETNVTEEYLDEGIGGFTEIFKNRVVLPFEGNYANFRHVIHHELVHAVINDMFYGGSLQNVISKNISVQLPLWFHEGMAEYQSLGWDTNTDMFIRDAIINQYLPDLTNLSDYAAYRAGQSLFYYISQKYGREKIGELINKTKGLNSFEEGLKASIGLNYEELNERWKKELKKAYWPDIATRQDPDEFSKRLTNHKKDGGFYNTSPALSPQGDKIAFISNRNFYFDVYIMNSHDGKIIKRIVEGNRSADFEELNILTPGLDWSPDGKKIVVSAKTSGYDAIHIIDVEDEDEEQVPVKMLGIASVKWSPDGKFLTFIGHNGQMSDLYIYDLQAKVLVNLTNDIFSESDPAWAPDGKSIFFSSDRKGYTNPAALPDSFNIAKFDYSQMDIYRFDIASKTIERITDLPHSDETSSECSGDGKQLIFISSFNGINNIYTTALDHTIKDDSTDIVPITNSLNGLYQLSVSKDGKKLAFSSMYEGAYNIFLLTNPFEPKTTKRYLTSTIPYNRLFQDRTPAAGDTASAAARLAASESGKDSTASVSNPAIFTGEVRRGGETDTASVSSGTPAGGRQIFGNGQAIVAGTDSANTQINPNFSMAGKLDSNGNYLVNKYKITFSPDIIYANAGYSTLYGLLGTTVLSFSDMLGNHRIVGVTSLQIDLKNSDYGLAYYYLPKKIDFGIEGFHTARFVYLTRNFADNLFRFRNYGAVGSMSYPLSKFYRFDASLAWLNVSSENLDNPDEETEKISYVIPSISFVHDNVLWGYTSPIDGTRYNLTLFGNPISGKKKLSFYSFTMDFRNYNRFWYDNSFVFRLSGGVSGGENPQRFFLGGTENWINRTFTTQDIPIESASDFAFLTPAMPLRGYNYAERIGTKYALMNLELRMPLIRYLVTGPIPLLFQNILGTAFVDMGSAWDDTKSLKFFKKDPQRGTVSQDMLMGTGAGARIFFLYFLVRFDVAWSYDLDVWSKPKYYISLGADF